MARFESQHNERRAYVFRGGDIQEDANGEKLTMKKWWIFGADLFHGLRRVFHGL